MTRLTPHELARIAQEERARRAAAMRPAVEAGMISLERASDDDALWSNIVHCARHHAGDAAAMASRQWYWTAIEWQQMATSARATFRKALEKWPATDDPAIMAKLTGLRDLTCFLETRPAGPWQAVA